MATTVDELIVEIRAETQDLKKAIEETSGDELTIFTETGIFEFKSQNKNRVKTKIKF